MAAIAAGVGLAAGIPLGAVLFGDRGSEPDNRRSGSLIVRDEIVSTTCSRQTYSNTGPGAVASFTLVLTSASSRFLSTADSVQSRFIFYKQGAVIHTEAWGPARSLGSGQWEAGETMLEVPADSPDRARVEWKVRKDVFPMFASC